MGLQVSVLGIVSAACVQCDTARLVSAHTIISLPVQTAVLMHTPSGAPAVLSWRQVSSAGIVSTARVRKLAVAGSNVVVSTPYNHLSAGPNCRSRQPCRAVAHCGAGCSPDVIASVSIALLVVA